MRRSQLIGFDPPLDGIDQADLLQAAGFVWPLDDGLMTLLPLGQRVLGNIQRLVRRAFEGAGGLEVVMPLLQPAALWDRVNLGGRTRAESQGRQLMRVQRPDSPGMVLAPTHEEVATLLAVQAARPGARWPQAVYQIQPRFRDAAGRLGAGLLRTREFQLADAYSFDVDALGLDRSYAIWRQACASAVEACGVNAEWVQASGASMGGEESHELVASIPQGRQCVAWRCRDCGRRQSVDIAAADPAPARSGSGRAARLRDVEDGCTPKALAAHLQSTLARRLVWEPFLAGQRLVLVVRPADRRLHKGKLLRALTEIGLDPDDVVIASAEALALRGHDFRDVSLVESSQRVLIVADRSVLQDRGWHAPAPHRGQVLDDLCAHRDFRVDHAADVVHVRVGDRCRDCGGRLRPIHGVEVGHVFKLGTTYTEPLGARSAQGPLYMGCYGIGLTRLLATIALQHQRDGALAWPPAVSPFAAAIVPRHPSGPSQRRAEELHDQLQASGIDVLLDDGPGPMALRLPPLRRIGLPGWVEVTPTGLRWHDRQDSGVAEAVDIHALESRLRVHAF